MCPLNYFLGIFNNADITYFGQFGGVSAHYKELPNEPVYCVKLPKLEPTDWSLIGGPYVEVKAIELALDFRRDMRRWHLLQPKVKNVDEQSRAEVLTGYLRQWTSVMISAKTAQMQSENRNDWPSEVPWDINELRDMPVVLWLKRQRQDY